jgi:hypothetical protein
MGPSAAWRQFWRVLLFREEAFRAVAGSGWALFYGVVAALIAGLARHYDRVDPDTPWLWVGPALSLLVALVTALVFALAAWCAGARSVSLTGITAVVLATAPLGWLYAIPFRLLLGPDGESAGRGAVLVLVSIWRVAVLLEAYRALLGLGVWRRALAFLTPLAVFAGACSLLRVFALTTTAVLQEMAGIGADRSVQAQTSLWVYLVFLFLVVWPAAVVVRVYWWLPKDRVPSQPASQVDETERPTES